MPPERPERPERPDPPAPHVPATPDRDRAARSETGGFRLIAAGLTVTLLADPHRARFAYECHLETTGDAAALYWCYHLPSAVAEVSDLYAWDGRGGLQPRVHAEASGSRLEVRLRYPVAAGERYTFAFGYETSIRPVVVRDRQRCTVTYADWVTFDIPCILLQVKVKLPEGAGLVAAVPACAESDNSHVTYRVRALRALETVSFLLAYSTDDSGARDFRPQAETGASQPPAESPRADC